MGARLARDDRGLAAGFWPGWPTWWTAAGVAVLVVPLAVLGTQYLQGWLLQVFGAWTGRVWPAAALATAAVPALSLRWHVGPLDLAADAVVVLAMYWLTVRTGGLEAALGLFLVDALVAELVVQSQRIPALGPEGAPVPPLVDLSLQLSVVAGVLVYVWWTDAAAPTPPPGSGTGTGPRRPAVGRVDGG